jgi:hypothetical protein
LQLAWYSRLSMELELKELVLLEPLVELALLELLA